MQIKILLAVLGCVAIVRSATQQDSIRQQMKDDSVFKFESSGLFEKYILGSMNNYLTSKELNNLMNELVYAFPEVFRKV